MVICSLQEVSYLGFTAMEVVIYPIGKLLEVSDLGFTFVEVVIYPEDFNHAAQGRMVMCCLQRVLFLGYTAVEVVFYPIFYLRGVSYLGFTAVEVVISLGVLFRQPFFFRLVFLVLGW